MSAARTPKVGPMSCVMIGHREYLLPADKGMKLVELLQHAVECERKFEGGDYRYTYEVGEAPNVEFALVQHGRIRMPQGVEPFPVSATRPALSVARKLLK